MKKIFALTSLVMSVLLMGSAPEPDAFEGFIRYKTEASGKVPEYISRRLAETYDLMFKGADIRIVGTAPLKATILLKKQEEKMFIIRSDQNSIYELGFDDKRIPASPIKTTVTATKDVASIAGYSCRHFAIQYPNGGIVHVWTTPEIKVASWGTAGIFHGQFDLPADVPGIPLKIELATDAFTVRATAIEVKASMLNPSDFNLPEDMSVRTF